MISFKKLKINEEDLSLSSKCYFIKNIYKIIYKNKDIGHIKEYSRYGKESFLYNLHIPNNFFGNHKGFSEISRRDSFESAEKSLNKSIKSLINKCNK